MMGNGGQEWAMVGNAAMSGQLRGIVGNDGLWLGQHPAPIMHVCILTSSVSRQ